MVPGNGAYRCAGVGVAAAGLLLASPNALARLQLTALVFRPSHQVGSVWKKAGRKKKWHRLIFKGDERVWLECRPDEYERLWVKLKGRTKA